jgi:hypothetical protein
MTFVVLPDVGQSLGQTRANIRENFNIIQDAFGRNHVSLNDGTPGNRGKHNFCTFVAQGSTPTPRIAGESYLFSRTFNSVAELAFCPNVVGNVYQLTRTIETSTSTFANNTNYTGTQSGGWTFLPGGMLLQYGSKNNLSTTGTITFPTAFTGAPYSITVSMLRTSASNDLVVVDQNTPPTNTGFNYKIDIINSSGNTLYWMAIGV